MNRSNNIFRSYRGNSRHLGLSPASSCILYDMTFTPLQLVHNTHMTNIISTWSLSSFFSIYPSNSIVNLKLLTIFQVKSLCIVLSMSVMFISNFIMLAAYTATVDLLGLDGTFFLYAAVAAASAVVSYLIVPETSGITTEAIQEKFARGFLQYRVLVKE